MTTTATTTTASAISSGSSSLLGGSRTAALSGSPHNVSNSLNASSAQFREIHKNTWLKRLTAEGKRITVGPKKSDRSWVVFCVHDDTEALLEGYPEPRQTASHQPEWIVSMKDTLHISHALIPNSHEFEFVVTLSNEVVRFHAMSWEIMQEWVETLRSKLREMKILSPRENLYTKLPEIRAPLLPTRDPTSPLPAPPPVPAALVPGVERVVPSSILLENLSIANDTNDEETNLISSTTNDNESVNIIANACNITTAISSSSSSSCAPTLNSGPALSSMSNTLTQNLLNMLSDPISAYSEHLNDASNEIDDDNPFTSNANEPISVSDMDFNSSDFEDEFLSPLLRKSTTNAASCRGDNSVRVDIGAFHRTSADQIKMFDTLMQCDRLIPRPHTSRSLSAGAADKSNKQNITNSSSSNYNPESVNTSNNSNITAFEIVTNSNEPVTITPCTTVTSNNCIRTLQTQTTAAAPVQATDPKANITIIQVSTENNSTEPPRLPVKNIIAEIFKFPETTVTTKAKHQCEYKSNVQIIPSNQNSSGNTIQVLSQVISTTAEGNQYSTPIKHQQHQQQHNAHNAHNAANKENAKVTTVHVAADVTTATTITSSPSTPPIFSTTVQSSSSTANITAAGAAPSTTAELSVYGTCFAGTTTTTSPQVTPKLSKKIILSANTSGITNITVNNVVDNHTENVIKQKTTAPSSVKVTATLHNDSGNVKQNVGTVHYDKVFLSTSAPMSSQGNTPTADPIRSSARRQVLVSSAEEAKTSLPTSTAELAAVVKKQKSTATASNGVRGSPALQRRRVVSPSTGGQISSPTVGQPPLPIRPPFLTRGLTEAVITTRPSRRDFHFVKIAPAKMQKSQQQITNNGKNAISTNNNGEFGVANSPLHIAVSRTTSESLEQRKRSSSTSDARHTRSANNNEFSTGNRGVAAASTGLGALRIQQPPQPFRNVMENGVSTGGLIGNGPPSAASSSNVTSPSTKRMTLREQQVMQLRREIMHPGGVRLQLRRKDCVGSIAWVDCFGAVWVAGWKQKEHPVLYNALHIGDQLLSIAGATISTAAEANKIIRNANTLFVEVLVRRIPFGRGYAIKREREGQCLGLIRDGNTSTIVDVVPNSLAARHGLPPKAQSCDGTTLTFWVLTEINGRPLNLFFKENEIRDRLNSVGRDISILVQPSDLITKLKKQLKSLRGYKDYLVQ